MLDAPLPAHELAPFDARDELIAEMLEALTACAEAQQPMQHAHATEQARAAIEKAKTLRGSSSGAPPWWMGRLTQHGPDDAQRLS